jgi:hypothetical protein
MYVDHNAVVSSKHITDLNVCLRKEVLDLGCYVSCCMCLLSCFLFFIFFYVGLWEFLSTVRNNQV